jgi:hypothetical protein
MLEAISTPRNRFWTLIFLIVCGVSAIAAGVVGISDNPRGILLAFLSAAALILAFVPATALSTYGLLGRVELLEHPILFGSPVWIWFAAEGSG